MNLQKLTAGRTLVLLLTAGLLSLSQGLFAQTSERIMLSKRQITVGELFREVERQTRSTIIVRANVVNDGSVIEMPSQSGTLDEIFKRVLAGTGKEWQRNGDYIIIGTQPTVAAARTPEPPKRIVIDSDELKHYAPEAGRRADSIIYSTIETGPYRFSSEAKTFGTPGAFTPGGRVVAPFTTAERWQRSKLALKTNVLYGAAALAPNLRGEIGLGNRTSLELGAAYNGWNLNGTVENNKKLVHGVALGEFRYWLCERFEGHYFGVHAFTGFYNVGGHEIPTLFEKEYRYEGTHYGGGISYGYMLPLSPRWGLEFNVGVGVAQMRYDKYGCDKCADLEGTFDKTYFGPTRAGINLVFIIK